MILYWGGGGVRQKKNLSSSLWLGSVGTEVKSNIPIDWRRAIMSLDCLRDKPSIFTLLKKEAYNPLSILIKFMYQETRGHFWKQHRRVQRFLHKLHHSNDWQEAIISQRHGQCFYICTLPANQLVFLQSPIIQSRRIRFLNNTAPSEWKPF